MISIISNDFSLPWIPFEYHNYREKAKTDFKAEMWACSTTLWEIFSQGRAPTLREFYSAKRRLPPPHDCPEYVYEIMREGWDESPDKRFSPQALIAKLMGASMFKLNSQMIKSISNENKLFIVFQVKCLGVRIILTLYRQVAEVMIDEV